jgi:hypothetical protein
MEYPRKYRLLSSTLVPAESVNGRTLGYASNESILPELAS